jgi:broad specificity phosphatase PhoE
VTTILLARHGESDWNAAGRWQGHTDRPLTELGRRQAHLLGRQLATTPIDAAYASDLRRAWETAELALAGRGILVVRLRSLREVNVGSWAGLTAWELEDRFPQELARWRDGGTGWSGGETYDEMAERVVAAVGEIAARHDGGCVLVVSHGGPLRAVKAPAAEMSYADYRLRHPVEPNAVLSAVAVQDGRIRAVD